MNRAMNWFKQQSRRDQAALAMLAMALAVYALVKVLVMPLQAAVELSQARLTAAQQSLANVQALAAKLAGLQEHSASGSSAENIALLVDASAARAGVQILSMEPAAEGNSVALRVDELALAVLMQWLQQLARDGITVENLVLLPSRSDSLVSANLRLVNSL